MASTAELCFAPLLPYLQEYHVILAEIDGHSERMPGDLTSILDCCDDIEGYIKDHLDGKLHGLIGFSMGGTMAVELIGRGNIEVERTLLDAAFVIRIGAFLKPLTFVFCKGIERIKKGKSVPKWLMGRMFGRDNTSLLEMFYPGISQNTVKNCLKLLDDYRVPETLRNYKNPVTCWCGEYETMPVKGFQTLKLYLPQMTEEVKLHMGHGQFLHEHSEEYAKELISFMES